MTIYCYINKTSNSAFWSSYHIPSISLFGYFSGHFFRLKLLFIDNWLFFLPRFSRQERQPMKVMQWMKYKLPPIVKRNYWSSSQIVVFFCQMIYLRRIFGMEYIILQHNTLSLGETWRAWNIHSRKMYFFWTDYLLLGTNKI